MSGSSRSAPPQGRGEVLGVGADLAMVDDAVDAMVLELDRILDRDNVVPPVLVGIVDNRRQRRGLAATSSTGHQDEPFLGHRESPRDRR